MAITGEAKKVSIILFRYSTILQTAAAHISIIGLFQARLRCLERAGLFLVFAAVAILETHHKGKKDIKGGSANFVFVDGHVEQTTVLETIKKRRWGDKFWSLTGDGTGVYAP